MNKKKILYLVTDGTYSDYRVCGVYDTRQRASYAKRLFSSDNDIEEYALNDLPKHPRGTMKYSVIMDRDGNSKEAGRVGASNGIEFDWKPCGWDDLVEFEMWAKDEEHAVKIANERRIQLIASGEWTADLREWANR